MRLLSLFIYSLLYLVGADSISVEKTIGKNLGANSNTQKLLILTNTNEKILKDQFSVFISDLISSGYNVIIKSYNKFSQESDLKLLQYGELIYNNLLIFDISTLDFHPTFPIVYVPKILEFIDKGGNIFSFVDTLDENNLNIETNKGINKLTKECAGITLLPQSTRIIDISTHGPNYSAHIHSNNCIDSDAIFSPETCSEKGILYHGVGFYINNPNNELIVPILSACNTCISIHNSIQSKLHSSFGNFVHSSTSEEIGLIVSMQGRNNARATYSADGKLCSDITVKSNIRNRQFCQEVLSWSFQRKGLLKMDEASHYKINKDIKFINEHYDDTLMYTVEDVVNFSAKFYKLVNNNWESYQSDDIQLEFTMLDPYIRTYLKRNMTEPSGPIYSTTFKIPEVWGVYKFVINYKRMGYNTISYESTVTVRNFRHDQNERFIISAFPYYSTFIVALISFCYLTHLFISQ
ncbi:Dolichyl-diphosphooligosaccharide--protein glycosyltransferase 48 kDa subunit [Cryptosporidium felis]|nr:Dolichyl-diphosphooligosaccharide--protein glycosyltransferase 48 kDa subunit [Cryptosporidium felis]